MGYLPIFVDLDGRRCIVIGSGQSAEPRIRALLDAGAIVTVVSREADDAINLRDAQGRVSYLAREYQYGDLRGSSLVYITTGEADVVHRAADEARELGIPLSVLDHPDSSTFINPASFKRGDLQIAISTSGASPSVARIIRQRLEQQFGPEYALLLKVMRRARHFLRSRQANQTERSCMLQSLAAALLDSVVKLDHALVERTLRMHIGAGIAELGLDLDARSEAGGHGQDPSSNN